MLSRRFLRIKALKAIYGHMCGTEESIISTQKRMLFGIEKSYDLYAVIMQLPVELSKYAHRVININLNKFITTEEDKNPNMYLVNNRLISEIGAEVSLTRRADDSGFSWEEHEDVLKKVYQRVINREYYKRYMANEDSFENDKTFLTTFFRKEIEDYEPIYDVLEEASVYWNDEIDFITVKCMSNIYEMEESKLFVPYGIYQKLEDKDFVKDLLFYTLSDMDKNMAAMKENLKNWDIERVTLMDRIIISMAMSEINHFTLIPVKATFDEYIEISKHYSTSNSNTFINGILDKYVTQLKAEDKLNKTGRGLN